ncbi:sulfatase-like hydrolase/transferase [Microvirga sp. STR05]|uniref:Sulfatase-like hydrolase/transferase n=1 Tax=Hymenobacter duratus TaxID=2771356 RepID=A0ABR8JIA9_9BACT|nr:alkaline phosphatase family protein [Hymenobacter duratus]MBD2716586.1 sulfatase-like hydrolase/transferase [Hymenobacter duratus]MBR7951501.1 sulfatase-like hydrolase/transferase [Microvirga sp. STR05]
MRNRFAFQPRYYLFWLLFFLASKGLFLLYHFSKTALLPAGTIAGVAGYGLRLDASAAAYISLLPFVLVVGGSLLGSRFGLDRLVRFYTAVVGVVVAFLTTIDLELYRTWGFRLDSTPLQYLNSPAEMAASAGSAPLLLLLGAFIGLLALGYLLYNKVVGTLPLLPAGFGRGRAALVSLLYATLLIVPLRGGVQQIPVNQSDVYFSSQPFANHAAVNLPWNVVNALTLSGTDASRYRFLTDSVSRNLVRPLYTYTDTLAPAASTSLLRTPRPNVVFIILESFTSKFVGCTGGESGVTPNLDSLARTGVLFSNLYAAGDRSQKGLVALLSGYPSQPTPSSIIKFPRKTERLPHLCQSLKQAGYSSHYYYGGELAFANMKSYLMTAGYEQLTERSDFPKSQQNSKWGAHDHVLFDRVLTDLRTQRQPFFTTAFTLSSHEPFEIPIPRKFRGSDETALFRNSVYYTDWALGRFLQQARQQPWYDNTLLVLVADHGHTLPGFNEAEEPAKFRIPLVLAGGALRPEVRGRVLSTLGSQTDIAATLLAQLRLPTTAYRWSRDLLRPVQEPSAFYCYTDGFGFVTPAGTLTFDNISRRETSRTPGVPDKQLRQGQAYEQLSMEDYLAK